MHINISLLQMINSYALSEPSITAFFVFLADQFDWMVMIVALVFLLLFAGGSIEQRVRRTLAIFGIAGVAWGIGYVLKMMFAVPRPFVGEFAENILNYTLLSHSFPSGHATFFSALGFAIFFRNRVAGILFLVFALAILTARIAVGVHYPLDIIGGWVLGLVVAYSFHRIKLLK